MLVSTIQVTYYEHMRLRNLFLSSANAVIGCFYSSVLVNHVKRGKNSKFLPWQVCGGKGFSAVPHF